MKCKFCGQEIVVDDKTKVGVCVGCGKKFAISTVAREKVCKVCNTGLVNKEVYWECPNCGKKYTFSKKKTEDNKNTVDSNNIDLNKPNVNEHCTDTINNDLSENFFDIDIDVTTSSEKLSEDNVIQPNCEDNDVIIPSGNFDDSDTYVPDTFSNSSSVETDNDIIDNNIANQNYDNFEDDILDDEILDDDSDNKLDLEAEKNGETLSNNLSSQIQENEENQISLENSESDNHTEYSQTAPELYDEDGNAVGGLNSSVNVSSLQSMANSNGKKASKGISVVSKIFAIVFGILSVLSGIACFIFSQYDFVEKLINLSVGNLLPTLQKVSTLVFFGILVLMTILATVKKIGFKRIGTIISIVGVVLLILTVCFEKKLAEENFTTYVIYAGYALLLLGSFLTMVINCNSTLSKTANAMGIVLFVFSLVSLLAVALQMLPLKALKLAVLENYVQYLKDIDKVLLGFASISSAFLIAKSE